MQRNLENVKLTETDLGSGNFEIDDTNGEAKFV